MVRKNQSALDNFVGGDHIICLLIGWFQFGHQQSFNAMLHITCHRIILI